MEILFLLLDLLIVPQICDKKVAGIFTSGGKHQKFVYKGFEVC